MVQYGHVLADATMCPRIACAAREVETSTDDDDVEDVRPQSRRAVAASIAHRHSGHLCHHELSSKNSSLLVSE